MPLAEDIRAACRNSGLVQAELAARVDISQVAIARFIGGGLELSADTLEALAVVCGYVVVLRRPQPGRPPQKARPADRIWDTVTLLWFPEGVAPSERARVGKLVRDLKGKEATAQEIHRRWKRCQKESPELMWGPEGFAKQWSQFSDETWQRR